MKTRRSQLLLLSVVAAALAGVVMLAIPGSPIYKKPTLGLDLQGGLEVVLKAVPPKGYKLTEEDLDRSVNIMRERIDKLGVSEPEIRKQVPDQIIIELAGVHDQAKAAALIGKTAQLEFYDLEADLLAPSINASQQPVATSDLYSLLSTQQQAAKKGTPTGYYVVNTKTKRVVAGPEDTKQKLLAAERFERFDGKLPPNHKFFAVPQGRIVLHCPAVNGCPGTTTDAGTATYYYVMRYQPDHKTKPIPELTGDELKLSDIRADVDTSGGRGNVVRLAFTGEGNRKFHEITRQEAHRGAIRREFQHFAIVLDREIKSTPYIDYEQNPDGIDPTGGGAEISNIRTFGEARDLALVLQTGALPVEFEQIERTDISATLGEDSLREALRAALAGLAIVALFLLIFYRFLGLVAVIGLGIYAALTYAAVLILDVTLTLPGFAGMILTIGVAADANIVIFERIKEESGRGKSVRAAIGAGYTKGFGTIVDANVVTAITAMILFAIATAGVRGFALLLLLGTAISVVTAVFATRALLGLLAGFRWFDNPAFMGASGQTIAAWQRVDVMGRRRIWFAIAGALIALSIGSLIFKGLNLGIDFRGGTQVSFVTPQPVQVGDVREEAQSLVGKNAVIQGRGQEAASGGFRSFHIKTESLTPDRQDGLRERLERRFDADVQNVRNVSASFSEQILRSAIYALIFSFILITLYITLRFQWRFAVPILRTIANDGLIALGIYSLSGRELTAATVAAFLTIIGYSIYDTIIIFDRVRENIPLMRRSTVAEIINQSLWETVRRSLATTFITLLPVTALVLFGGETLKDFAFAILIGIGVSAFSTIFIAAPFLGVLLERSPEFRGRRSMTDEAAPTDGERRGAFARRLARPRPSGADGDGGTEVLEPPTPVGAATEPPVLGDIAPQPGAQAKRERRRQRRRARPHGRAR